VLSKIFHTSLFPRHPFPRSPRLTSARKLPPLTTGGNRRPEVKLGEGGNGCLGANKEVDQKENCKK